LRDSAAVAGPVADFPRHGAAGWLSAFLGIARLLAIRAGVPLTVLRDTIQPFPTFSEIYVAALKALRNEIAGAGQPAGMTSP
jgi:hypothetical protein